MEFGPDNDWQTTIRRSLMTCKTITWWAAGSILCCVALVAGCDTTGQRAQAKKATRAVDSMEQTRTELVRADQQVDEAMIALDRLLSSPAARPAAFKVYTAEVSEAARQADEAQQRADKMRAYWRDYITAWEMEVDEISTEGLQAKASERREAVRENYDRLRDAARATDAAYEPFLTHLRDIQAALALDLTPAGIEATQPAIDAARQSAKNLKQHISAFVSQIDQVAAATTGRAPAGAATAMTATNP